MGKPIVAVLEIGTTNTVLLVGEPLDGRRMRVSGRGVAQTVGVRKGLLIDLVQARAGIDTARRQAEEASGANVGEVLLGISGSHVATRAGEGRAPIRAGDGKASHEDVEEVVELAQTSGLANDRMLLHTVIQSYAVDELTGLANPVGIRGKQLRLDSLFIHGQRNRIDDAVTLLKGMAIETRGIAFSALAASMAVLTPDQRRHGVVLIDLGGGTTNYVVYIRDVLVAAGSFNVGGDHVTNDVAQAFSIPVRQAEELKLGQGSAVIDAARAGRRFDLPPSVGFASARSISLKALHTVIEARLTETLGLVREQLIEGHFQQQLGAGVVYTGGGAYMPGLDALTERIFGVPSRVGEPLQDYIEGLEQAPHPAAFAAAAGLLLSGAESYAADHLFGSMRAWLRKMTGGVRA